MVMPERQRELRSDCDNAVALAKGLRSRFAKAATPVGAGAVTEVFE